MSERAWNAAAWMIGGIVVTVGGVIWLTLMAVSVVIVAAGTYDILNWQPSWEKAAILLVFIRVLLTGRRVRKLDDKIDEVRMMTAATMCYLEIDFRNRRSDLPPGPGARLKDDLRQGLFSDKLLTGCYAARNGRKVTLADDLKSASPFR
jgi:hypothetical protein